jgi:hypothetical protein
MLDHVGAVADWAREEFGSVELGDVRRGRRLREIASRMASRPGSSLPKLFPRWRDLKPVYGLFRRKECRLDRIESEHWSRVRQRCGEAGEYLLVQDTTSLDYSGHGSVDGLGRIGDDGGRGFMLHTTLALRVEVGQGAGLGYRVMGLAHQKIWRRPEDSHHGRESRGERLARPRESQVWSDCVREIGLAPGGGARWILVGDRGSDVYETMVGCREQGLGFLLRACQDRVVEGGDHLYSVLRSAPSLGSFGLRLRGRGGKKSREARLEVSAVAVSLRPPWRPGRGLGDGKWERVWAVRVWEESVGDGASELEWILLSSGPVRSFAQARRSAEFYQLRWTIEEYHKCLKTGLRVESHQLKHADRLEGLIAVAGVVAVRLLAIKTLARLEPQAPASGLPFPSLWLEVLRGWYAQFGRVDRWDAEMVIKALGRLGGHLGRRGDGLPGWQALWSGWLRLQDMVIGAEIGAERFG